MLRFFRHYLFVPAIALFICDMLVGLLALYAGFLYAIPRGTDELLASAPWNTYVVGIVLISSTVMYSMGLYDKSSLIDLKQNSARLLVAFGVCLPIIVLYSRLALPIVGIPFSFLMRQYGLWLVAVVIADVGTRIAYASAAHSTLLQRRILVIGHGRVAAEIEQFVRQQRGAAISILGFVPVGQGPPLVSREKILAAGEDLPKIAKRMRVHEIVVAADDRRGFPNELLLQTRLAGVQITDHQSFWEREARKIYLDRLDPSWLIYSDGFQLNKMINSALKRCMDIVVSLLFLCFMLPVLVAAVIAIRLDSRGPIFYSQERVGKNNRIFTLYKFRTMRVDAECDGQPHWARPNDSRITQVGAILRMTRIDELPQVINVLKGEMSFVGPRPERPFFVENLSREIPFYAVRHLVQPGITGWAQINYRYGASFGDAKEKLAYELYYIKNYSLVFDLLIILMTVQVVLWNKGAR